MKITEFKGVYLMSEPVQISEDQSNLSIEHIYYVELMKAAALGDAGAVDKLHGDFNKAVRVAHDEHFDVVGYFIDEKGVSELVTTAARAGHVGVLRTLDDRYHPFKNAGIAAVKGASETMYETIEYLAGVEGGLKGAYDAAMAQNDLELGRHIKAALRAVPEPVVKGYLPAPNP